MNREPDEEVLMFLRIAVMCKRFNSLPGPGGILDQDGYIMMGTGLAIDALNEKERLDEERRQARAAAKGPK